MSLQSPRRALALARPRPSLSNQTIVTSSTPDLAASYSGVPPPSASAGLSAREAIARKASLSQLTSNSLATIPDGSVGYGLSTVADESASSTSPPMAPITPAAGRGGSGGAGGDIEIGDLVDVPGAMHGTVKFVGSVRGKKGTFAGVELSGEFAPRGKNDGDVDGTRYFSTSIPGAGIFLPVSRATKRASPTDSYDSFPPTPTTPSVGGFAVGAASSGDAATNSNSHPTYTPPTPNVPKFSQSVGPGRAPSPQFKPKSRPSLPRPESPLRKTQNLIATPARPSIGGQAPNKNTAIGGARYAASPTPGRLGSSIAGRRISSTNTHAGDPGKKPGFTPKATPARGLSSTRTGSALGRNQSIDEAEHDGAGIGVAQTADTTRHSSSGFPSRVRPGSDQMEEEVKRLKAQIEERDRQLKEQASSLAEMEDGFAELQSLLPANGSESGGGKTKRGSADDTDTQHLRSILREKNEKIAMLTAEFDAHRADFRSTIDTLELASTETERVYEKKVEDLQGEIRELHDRGEDVESVARQLKQLEELVQELEEGLEDARRGEAEARGEVEFLRGEVERGRSELRREREKAAAALKGAGAAVGGGGSGGGGGGGVKEVEQRDDEIRGLKAIIHSLSRDAVPEGSGAPARDGNGTPNSGRKRGSLPRTNGSVQRTSLQLSEERLAKETLQREVKELQGLVERKTFREEQLEQELQRLKRRDSGSSGQRASAHTIVSSGPSERTVTPGGRGSGGYGFGNRGAAATAALHDRDSNPRPMHNIAESTTHQDHSHDSGSELWCEVCETEGHDIMTCTNMFAGQQGGGGGGGARRQQPAARITVESSPPSAGSKRTGKEAVIRGLNNLSVETPLQEDAVRPLSPGRKPTNLAHVPPPPPPDAPPPSAMPNPNDTGMVAGKASGVVDADKWCALCERDGHESVDCPFEDAF